MALVIFVLVIITSFWIWKVVEVKSLKSEYNSRERAIIQATANNTEEANRQFLKLIAKPYVWAVRKELMQGNISQLNLYGSDIIKEKNFLSVMVANVIGTVVSSTDKKYEGKNILSVQSIINIKADSTIVGKINDSTYIVTSPIMSFNSKVGILVINYATVSPSLLNTQ